MSTTIYVEEALHRLVELHYKIGLTQESKKYAKLLVIIINQANGIKHLIKFLIKIMKLAKKKIVKKKSKKGLIIRKFKSLFTKNER